MSKVDDVFSKGQVPKISLESLCANSDIPQHNEAICNAPVILVENKLPLLIGQGTTCAAAGFWQKPWECWKAPLDVKRNRNWPYDLEQIAYAKIARQGHFYYKSWGWHIFKVNGQYLSYKEMPIKEITLYSPKAKKFLVKMADNYEAGAGPEDMP